MPVLAKACTGTDHILVDDPEIAKPHEVRLKVSTKTKGVLTVQPREPRLTARFASPNEHCFFHIISLVLPICIVKAPIGKTVLRESKMNWDDFKLFLAVSEGGTLTSAANLLGLNASTVSRRLDGLESSLQTTLFERTPRGYHLTRVGEALIPHAQDAREAILAARQTVLGTETTLTGEVRLSLVSDLLTYVAPIVPKVQSTGLTLSLQVTDSLLDIGRDTDLVLRPSDSPPESVVGRRLFPLAWAVYARSPDCTNWVAYRDCDHIHAVKWFYQQRAHERVTSYVTGVTGALAVLEQADCKGLLPCFLGDTNPRLKRVGAVIPGDRTALWLLYHATLRRAARVRAVTDVLIPQLMQHAALFSGDGIAEPSPR